jgi:tRNA(fMet)-specific endonuclease VapC
MSRVLVDTNIYSLAMRGDAEVVDALRRIDRIFISAVSLGELYAGFRTARREVENRQELARFLDSPRVTYLTIDDETAEFYAETLIRLKSQGTPIPTNDIWIAAVAFQHGLKLFTLDQHFRHVTGLVMFQAS